MEFQDHQGILGVYGQHLAKARHGEQYRKKEHDTFGKVAVFHGESGLDCHKILERLKLFQTPISYIFIKTISKGIYFVQIVNVYGHFCNEKDTVSKLRLLFKKASFCSLFH